jgi:hypothetical protein
MSETIAVTAPQQSAINTACLSTQIDAVLQALVELLHLQALQGRLFVSAVEPNAARR